MSLIIKAQTKESNKHTCNVSSIICHNDYIISGSDDGKIKLSKLANLDGKLKYSMNHNHAFRRKNINRAWFNYSLIWKPNLDLASECEALGGILSIAAGDNVLYSCSTGETIQSWDLKSGNLLGEIPSTLFQPQKLYVDKTSNILWAGDSQGNVAKFENGKEISKYELVEEIWDLMVSNNPSLIYTARDRDVVVCEIIIGTTATRVMTKSTLQGRSPFCIAGNRLCFLNREGRNVVIHENSVEKRFPFLNEIPASELIVNAITAASDNIIYTGGYDSTVKKWDLNTLKCNGSINLNSCINAFAALEENEIFIATSDGNITKVGGA